MAFVTGKLQFIENTRRLSFYHCGYKQGCLRLQTFVEKHYYDSRTGISGIMSFTEASIIKGQDVLRPWGIANFHFSSPVSALSA
jgi:hypothetical protein